MFWSWPISYWQVMIFYLLLLSDSALSGYVLMKAFFYNSQWVGTGGQIKTGEDKEKS